MTPKKQNPKTLKAVNFQTILLGPLLASMTGFQPVAAMSEVPQGFEYLNQGADETLYFGKIKAKQGDISFYTTYVVPATARNKKPYMHTYIMNCKTKQYKSVDGAWKSIGANSVGQDWINAACR